MKLSKFINLFKKIEKLLRNNFWVFILFILITYPAYSQLLNPGLITGHDTGGHVIRLIDFHYALSDGNFPVRWLKRINDGLGSPFVNFNYPLNYYIGDLLIRLGLSAEDSFKLIFVLTFPLSGFFAFLWLSQRFNRLASLFGGIYYTIAPYHFLNVYVRGNFGEVVALTLAPLGFYFIEKINQEKNWKNSIYFALAISGIILSHNLNAAIFLPIYFIYSFIVSARRLRTFSPREFIISFGKGIKNYVFLYVPSFILALGLSAFFWIPALIEKGLVRVDYAYQDYYLRHFVTLKDLIYSPWGHGFATVGVENGQMSVQIGIFHILIVFLFFITALFLFRMLDKNKIIALLFFSLILISVFLMQNISLFIWNTFTFLSYIQFPWRLLGLLILSIAFLSSFVFNFIQSKLNKKLTILIFVCFICGVFYANRNHWKVNEYYNVPDYWYKDSSIAGSTTPENEHLPRWQSSDLKFSDRRYEFINGSVDVKNTIWKTNYHRFDIDVKSDDVTFLDRTVFYSGWESFIDSQKVNIINPYDKQSLGLLAFKINAGNHIVESKFIETPLRKIANSVTLLSIVFILIMTLSSRLKINLK